MGKRADGSKYSELRPSVSKVIMLGSQVADPPFCAICFTAILWFSSNCSCNSLVIFYGIVHRLRVGDIKVVAAMGDSLTAANGARAWTVIGCLTNYRGTSWR